MPFVRVYCIYAVGIPDQFVSFDQHQFAIQRSVSSPHCLVRKNPTPRVYSHWANESMCGMARNEGTGNLPSGTISGQKWCMW